MLQFTDPIVAGTALARPAIVSPNYVPGVSGWAIKRDGSCEFNNGIFRGTVSASVFEGPDFIVTQQGIFLYTGPSAFTLALLQQLNDGPYRVQANEFDSAAAFSITGTTGDPYGFTIATSAINNVNPGSPGAYPSIFCGYHYGTASPGNPFPLQVSSIATGQVQTTLAVSLVNTGISDCVYDNWFNTAPVPPGANNATNGLEMMIWLASIGGTTPPGALVASNVSLNGYLFNVYFHGSWSNATKGTVSFQHVSQQTSVAYDMRPFMDYMTANGWLDPSWYLIAIEAGFEIWSGGVGHAINSFTVSNAPALPAGNLVTSISPTPGNDPAQGAAYLDGVIEGTPGFTQIGFRVESNVAELVYIVPGFKRGVIGGGQSGAFAFMELVGPANTAVGSRDAVVILMDSADGAGSSANANFAYADDAGGSHVYGVLDRTGLNILAGNVNAAQPGVTPATPETWHSFAPLATGYNITGGYADYLLTPDGRTSISAHIGVTAGPGIAFVQITTTPLPPLYRPSVDRTFPIGTNELAIFSGSNNAGALGKLATTGHIFVYGASTFATEIDIEANVRH